MKKIILLGLFFLSPIWAKPVLSPYTDVTLNPYWDNETQSMQPEDLTNISELSGVKSFHLAFLTDAGHCDPAWGGIPSYPVSFIKTLTMKMKAAKIDYTVSLGGAAGNDLSLNCTVKQLNDILMNTQDTLSSSSFDFDIENGTANIEKLLTAIQSFQSTHPKTSIRFTLPTMPYGLTEAGKSILRSATEKNIRYQVNIMAMDYGPAFPGNMADYAISASQSLADYLKTLYPSSTERDRFNMIGVTPMIGVNDVNIEHFTLENAKSLKEYGIKNQVGLLSFWSISRDKPCADKWANPNCSGQNLQQTPYAYAAAFNPVL